MAVTKLNSAALRAYPCPPARHPGDLKFLSEEGMAECLWLGTLHTPEYYINELEDGRFFAADNSLTGLTFVESIKAIDPETIFDENYKSDDHHRVYGDYFDSLTAAVAAATAWHHGLTKPPRCYNPPVTPVASPEGAEY